ncbi:MAG: restriction endonuclease [Planctomycetaceae bacterium]|nr:restriction endonuclease [Planctomycetaceae bacterium]MBL38684.1 restriction endonuclease [Xanthomonadales bacterium]
MSFPRYPEYKNSGVEWLGEVPAHWATLKLKHLARIRNGRDYKAVEVESEGYPVIGSGGPFSLASTYLYDGESLLLGRKGTVDKPLYVNGPFWTVDTMFYTELSEWASGRFLYYYATCFRFDMYSTNTALPSMAQEDLANIQLAVPGPTEQAAIAAFLDHETARIDALIEEQKRLIELLKEKRQAVISHAVTKGLDPDVPMKDSGVEWLGEVPAHWDVVAIKWLSVVQRGASPRPIEDPRYFDDNGKYGWVRIKDVTASNGLLSATTQTLSVLGSGLSVKLEPGQLFVSIAGTVGKPCITQIKACIHDGFVYFPELSIDPRFLQIIFESGLCYQGLGKMGTQLNLNTDTVGGIRIGLPSDDEIENILSFVEKELRKLDELSSQADHAVKLLEERRSALISAAVTGQIDVRGWQPPAGSSSLTEITAGEPA